MSFELDALPAFPHDGIETSLSWMRHGLTTLRRVRRAAGPSGGRGINDIGLSYAPTSRIILDRVAQHGLSAGIWTVNGQAGSIIGWACRCRTSSPTSPTCASPARGKLDRWRARRRAGDEAYVFDLDGTVLLGEQLLPTVAETVARLREAGRRILFLTNNPTKSPANYASALTAMGVPTEADHVVTSALVLVDHLRGLMPGARLMVIGEAALIQALETAGFEIVTEARRTDALIASFDRTFDYAKLQGAFDAVRTGARFFATNGDRYRPTPEGGEPDAASVIAAIEACTSRKCEQIVGKPSALTSRYLLERLTLNPDQCLLVGDRLETDVAMALQAGMSAALVLTGATLMADAALSPIKPTYVVNRLSDLLPAA